MANFTETFRIFGDELGVSDTYVDVETVDYSLEGNEVRLEDKNNSVFHDVPQTNLEDWQRKDLLLEHGNMPNGNIGTWTTLEDLDWSVDNEPLGPTTDEVAEMVRELFKLLVIANRSQS
jgi:hypothetical protein